MENNELMGILEQLERDKGINKEILIEAVESAVASAAKKLLTVDKEEEVKVVLNRKTGKLSAFAGTQEIRSSEFGRIAAQTAKQVVIQKIREAEKDFLKVIGVNVRFHLSEHLEDKLEYAGIISEVDQGNVSIQTNKKFMVIPITIIHKAFQIID